MAVMLQRKFQSGLLVVALLLMGAEFGLHSAPLVAARNLPAVAAVILAQRSSAEQSAQGETSTLAVPLPKGKKLVLKDGTFQIVREYQLQGDRVRYYSVERSTGKNCPRRWWIGTQRKRAKRMTLHETGDGEKDQGDRIGGAHRRPSFGQEL